MEIKVVFIRRPENLGIFCRSGTNLLPEEHWCCRARGDISGEYQGGQHQRLGSLHFFQFPGFRSGDNFATTLEIDVFSIWRPRLFGIVHRSGKFQHPEEHWRCRARGNFFEEVPRGNIRDQGHFECLQLPDFLQPWNWVLQRWLFWKAMFLSIRRPGNLGILLRSGKLQPSEEH